MSEPVFSLCNLTLRCEDGALLDRQGRVYLLIPYENDRSIVYFPVPAHLISRIEIIGQGVLEINQLK